MKRSRNTPRCKGSGPKGRINWREIADTAAFVGLLAFGYAVLCLDHHHF